DASWLSHWGSLPRPGQKYFGHHAAGTSAPTGLNGVQGTMEDGTMFFDGLYLACLQTIVGRRAHHHIGLIHGTEDLQHIARKLVHLCFTDLDDFPAVPFEVVHQVLPFLFIIHAVQTDDHKAFGHGHHHIGVVYG